MCYWSKKKVYIVFKKKKDKQYIYIRYILIDLYCNASTFSMKTRVIEVFRAFTRTGTVTVLLAQYGLGQLRLGFWGQTSAHSTLTYTISSPCSSKTHQLTFYRCRAWWIGLYSRDAHQQCAYQVQTYIKAK